MRLRCTEPPEVSPVTLTQAKDWLRVDGVEEEAMIRMLVSAATAYFDGPHGRLSRALEPQTWEIALDSFPSGPIDLPLGPVTAVDAVRYRDRDGVELSLDPARYVVLPGSIEGRVEPVAGWPETKAMPGAVTVRFQAGEGCPDPVRQGILMLVAHWYRNREAVSNMSNQGTASPVPLGVEAVIAQYRVFRR